MFKLPFKAAHDSTYNKTCATSEDSDQHAQLRSLTVLADRLCLPQLTGYPKRDEQVDIQGGYTGLVITGDTGKK